MKNPATNFLRGSLVLSPVHHVVIITTINGAQLLRHVALTLANMGALEGALMRLQNDGHIKSYIITAAEDCTFPELTAWVAKFAEPAEQPELLNIQTNTLFEGVL